MPEHWIMFSVWLALALVTAGVVVLRQWWPERKRRKACERLAEELGLEYVRRDRSLVKEYRFLDALRTGHNRYALNVLKGTYEGHPVLVFDYHYQTWIGHGRGPEATGHKYFSFLLLLQESNFLELRIYPRRAASKLGKMLGLAEVELESEDFSRAFAVKSVDRKLAYDVCHPRMMEYLLEHQDLTLEIEGPCLALSFQRRLEPWEIRPWLRRLVEIRRLFPEYLYRE